MTAFFDMGSFQKGPDDRYTPDKYFRWASVFHFLQNPLVVFTDSKELEQIFRRGNAAQDRAVKVILIHNRTSLFAFQNLDKVERIFADPAYPKFHPNTVLPAYSCMQHAKFDLVEKAISGDYFHTKYYAWVDLGYFRHITFRQRKFWVTVPPEMDDRKMAACEIESPDFGDAPEHIFKTNAFWVGGGVLMGTRDTYLTFIKELHRAMRYFLGLGLFNTDQQLIYSMFTTPVKEVLNVKTELQVFRWPLNWLRKCWFYLGYYCYREQ